MQKSFEGKKELGKSTSCAFLQSVKQHDGGALVCERQLCRRRPVWETASLVSSQNDCVFRASNVVTLFVLPAR